MNERARPYRPFEYWILLPPLLAVAFFLAQRLRFGLSFAARIVYGAMLFGAAVRMLLVNHSDYPQAFRLQQTIALACILCTVVGIYLSIRERAVNKVSG